MPRLFPEYNPLAVPTATQDVREIIFGNSWSFDFNKGEFVFTPAGTVQETEGVNSLIEWCKKTLLTPRAAYPIYDLWYGSDVETFMGKTPREGVVADIHRNIRESLMVDDRVKDVTGFKTTVEGDRLYTEFTVVAYNELLLPLSDERRVA